METDSEFRVLNEKAGKLRRVLPFQIQIIIRIEQVSNQTQNHPPICPELPKISNKKHNPSMAKDNKKCKLLQHQLTILKHEGLATWPVLTIAVLHRTKRIRILNDFKSQFLREVLNSSSTAEVEEVQRAKAV